MLAVAGLALVFPEPRTVANVMKAIVVMLTAPLWSMWYWPNARGPIPPPFLMIFFSFIPVGLLPAYALRPSTATCILTIVGAALWTVSGALMLALLFLD
jgi:hypothetical protein